MKWNINRLLIALLSVATLMACHEKAKREPYNMCGPKVPIEDCIK